MNGTNGNGPLLSTAELNETAAWLASRQESRGEFPWLPGGKLDPWNHVHAAMGLVTAGYTAQARRAYRYLHATQQNDGGWARWSVKGQTTDNGHESNQAAYLASGLWHLYLEEEDTDFLAEMWPVLNRAINFVVSLRMADGAISWALDPEGIPEDYPLLTGNSSTYGSLVSALRIAEHLGYDRPLWRETAIDLGDIIRNKIGRFNDHRMPDPPGRFSMDWYYPVLAGPIRDGAGRRRLLDTAQTSDFLTPGQGCRCVIESPWYTIAETCELAIAMDTVGLVDRAEEVFSWVLRHRTDGGAYHMGIVMPQDVPFPAGELAPWNVAALLIANDVLRGESATSDFFRSLGGQDVLEESPLSTGTDDSLAVSA